MPIDLVSHSIERSRAAAPHRPIVPVLIIIVLLVVLSAAFNAMHPAPVESFDAIVAAGL